ncbi:hypothetical protein J8273_4553 [Carpediemonas membranifera]|uniref:ESF1 RRM domain-containing protein n=1 Tax=Carpediemonas membranifera TaxID=201153 RepID=A0A8J6E1W1_9EUKA|nr:hypothetical protein J8273_4553 [Carpediemonas membranifera]|eukprot:KAG9393953.1 hypothetical protein J8273_4553 [Carpediemonas membranifera]
MAKSKAGNPRKRDNGKVKLDKRFAEIYEDPDFQTVTVDQYGQKQVGKNKDLDEFYEYDGETANKADEKADSSDGETSAVDTDAELTEPDLDLNQEYVAPEDQIMVDDETHRLAIQNMAWDLVNADDLFVVFTSFLPPGGRLLKVDKYVSEFGKTRLEREATEGPAAFLGHGESLQRPSTPPDRISRAAQEKLRGYELDRMKYFYAIATFDSPATALSIYNECDGKEFELSGTSFDLRFVPEDMPFDEAPADTASSIPVGYTMKAGHRVSAAMDTRVESSWDVTDVNRRALTHRQHGLQDLVGEDFDAMIGSGSEDEARGAEYRGLVEAIQEENPGWGDAVDEEMRKAEELRRIMLEAMDSGSESDEEDDDDDTAVSGDDEAEADSGSEADGSEDEDEDDEEEEVTVDMLVKYQALLDKVATRPGRYAKKRLAEYIADHPTIEAAAAADVENTLSSAARFPDLAAAEFNLDPSHASFKRTPGAVALLKKRAEGK